MEKTKMVDVDVLALADLADRMQKAGHEAARTGTKIPIELAQEYLRALNPAVIRYLCDALVGLITKDGSIIVELTPMDSGKVH